MCWPANTIGAFFVALLILDMFQKNYTDLPYHALYGGVITFLFWVLCSFIGESVTGGILVIPAVFLSIFLFTIWFTNESMKKRGCCMNCGGDSQKTCKKGRLVKKSTIDSSSGVNTAETTTLSTILGTSSLGAVTKCNNTLTATSL